MINEYLNLKIKVKMKKIAQQIVLHALQMNSDAEVIEIVCQWRNIVMESNIVPMEAMKICADLRQIQARFLTMTAKISQDYSHVMTHVSRS